MIKQAQQDLSILIIEDDSEFTGQVAKLFGVYNDVTTAGTIVEARSKLDLGSFDVILLDKTLPDGSGLDLIPRIRADRRNGVIIVITGDDNFNQVQKCIDTGANDYLLKTSHIMSDLLVRIPIAVRQAIEMRRSVQLESRLKEAFRYEIIGRSASTADLRATVQTLKGSLSPILITGESGTSKELIARRLNAIEDRCRPFIAVNCGAIPENLIESELFGHQKGSFSGAHQDQPGKFELADGGDLFLDEIGELPFTSQAKLLRVLQEGEIFPLGARMPTKISVRVIAATNQSIEKLLEERKFRSDLYYRLNVFRIATTPLRERTEDIPDLVNYFAAEFGGSKFSVSTDATKFLMEQPWPGNIRELRNATERAVLIAKLRKSVLVERADLTTRQLGGLGFRPIGHLPLPKVLEDISPEHYSRYLIATEKDYIDSVIQLCGGNISEAAKKMGMGRSTLFRRTQEFGLTRSKNLSGQGFSENEADTSQSNDRNLKEDPKNVSQ